MVVGKIGEQYVNLGEDLNYAEYTTMLSEEFEPMSELIKFDFPQVYSYLYIILLNSLAILVPIHYSQLKFTNEGRFCAEHYMY